MHYFNLYCAIIDFSQLSAINPLRACARVTVVAVSVCLCACVCPLSHISPLGFLFVVKTLQPTQWATKVKKVCGVFSEHVQLQRLSATSLDGHTSGRPFSYRKHACALWIYYTRVLDKTARFPYAITVSSPYILALQRSLQG